MPNTSERGYTIAAIARALDVLAAFQCPPHEFGPSELARRLGMTKNHVFRVLKTFEEHGYVRRIDDRYMIGMRAFEIGQLAIKRLEVVRVAQPIVRELHARTGETVHLAVLDSTSLEAVCVDRMESEHAVRLSAEVGRRFPLHAGACPKVLLAFLPESEREAVLARGLPAFTSRTNTDAQKLRSEVEQVRCMGYAVADEDLDPGASAVAAPIRQWTGEVIAAISVAGPISRVGAQLRSTLRDEVVAAAECISQALGYSQVRRDADYALTSPA